MNIYPKAFIFDLNGTMIDDMSFHARAWYDILRNTLGARLSLEEVKKQMYGKNEEVLERVFGKGHFTDGEMKKISLEKERRYQRAFLPDLRLIDGLREFLERAWQDKLEMAIGTAAIPFNIDFVLDNLGIRHYFKAIVSADDVTLSKPDPEVFTKAASLMGVEPEDCLVFEDAPKGVEAAANARMKAVVITTTHQKEEFTEYNNAIAYVKDYTDKSLERFISF